MPTPQRVLDERASIDSEVEGETIGHVLLRNAERHGDRPALSWKEGDVWRTLIWGEYRERAAEVAMGLRSLGIGRGDFVALMARNRPEHLIGDLGVVHSGGTAVSIYKRLPPSRSPTSPATAGPRWPSSRAATTWSDGRRSRRTCRRSSTWCSWTTWTTSPTTTECCRGSTWSNGAAPHWRPRAAGRNSNGPGGRSILPTWPPWSTPRGRRAPPKGVMITHRNVLWTTTSLARTGIYEQGLRAISYLPLAHIAERMATHYLGMLEVAHVHTCPDVLKVFEFVPEVRPQAFLGVPRVWEKLQAGIVAALAAEPDQRKRKIALKALEVGRKGAALEADGKPVPLVLKLQRALFEKLVFSKVRHSGSPSCPRNGRWKARSSHRRSS